MGRESREQRKAEKLAKNRERLVKSEFAPTLSKTPKVPTHDDANKAGVLWSFQYFDGTDWRHGDTDGHISFCDVATRLNQYSNRTWGDILGDPTRDHPSEPSRLCTEAQQRLIELGFDDVSEVLRFRFDGTQRLWGFRDRQYFVVLWWDPDHQVYPVEKKNT